MLGLRGTYNHSNNSFVANYWAAQNVACAEARLVISALVKTWVSVCVPDIRDDLGTDSVTNNTLPQRKSDFLLASQKFAPDFFGLPVNKKL